MINYKRAYFVMRKDIEKAIEQIRNGQISEDDARLQFSLIKTGEMYDICMNDETENN